MKKILFLLTILFTYIFYNNIINANEANTIVANGERFNVILENNYIKLQVDKTNFQQYDVYEYLENFKVKLVNDSREVLATNYDYNINQGQVFISNKSIVKKNYTISVEFYEVALTKDFQLTIEVNDFIKPNIILNNNIIQDIELNKIEESVLKTYFDISDNYNKKEELKLEFLNYKQINSKVVGDYNLKVKVIDLNNNYIIKDFIYKVIDTLPPQLKIKKPLELYINEVFNFNDFFEVKDNTDVNPITQIDLDNIKFNKIGIYDLNLTLIDKYNNSKNFDLKFKILDNGVSKINLRKQFLNILVFEKNYLELIKENVENISDLSFNFNIEDLTIDTSFIDFNIVGKYKLTYYLYKDNKLRAKQQIDVNINDETKPEIRKINDLIIPYKSVFNILNYFEFNDNYTDKNNLNIKYEPKTINTNELGIIYITLTVKDQQDNTTQEVFEFLIKDINPPIINNLKQVYTIDVGQALNLDIFDITDETNITKRIEIEDNQFYKKLGTYNAKIIAIDLYENKTEEEVVIKVVDDTDPILIIKQDLIKQEINNEEIDLKSFIQEVSDNYDNLSIDDVEIKHNINYTKTGKYIATFILKDSQENTTIVNKDIYIDDYSKPIVKEIKELVLDNDFSLEKLTEGLEITDNSNNFIIDTNIEKIKTNLNSNVKLIYYITDKKGNLTVFERDIKIKYKNKFSTNFYILLFSISYIILIILLYLIINYLKYKNFNFVYEHFNNIKKIFKSKK